MLASCVYGQCVPVFLYGSSAFDWSHNPPGSPALSVINQSRSFFLLSLYLYEIMPDESLGRSTTFQTVYICALFSWILHAVTPAVKFTSSAVWTHRHVARTASLYLWRTHRWWWCLFFHRLFSVGKLMTLPFSKTWISSLKPAVLSVCLRKERWGSGCPVVPHLGLSGLVLVLILQGPRNKAPGLALISLWVDTHTLSHWPLHWPEATAATSS